MYLILSSGRAAQKYHIGPDEREWAAKVIKFFIFGGKL